MTELAIIGGTGLTQIPGFDIVSSEWVETLYGRPSSRIVTGFLGKSKYIFIARHGDPHTIPPHKINYRANIQALKILGVRSVISIAAVGGIDERAVPGKLMIPDQIIDYTYGREHTFFDGETGNLDHIDFTEPYSNTLRQKLIRVAQKAGVETINSGVYGCTQGPRLETAAEIGKLEKDGCSIVGMTGMPEASLAKEAGLDYACCSVVANWAAGKAGTTEITMEEIKENLSHGMSDLHEILRHWE